VDGVRQGRGERVRIVDVARVAGVSAQTVSNVMNRRSGYAEDTRSTRPRGDRGWRPGERCK
jgi:hypothetical protein